MKRWLIVLLTLFCLFGVVIGVSTYRQAALSAARSTASSIQNALQQAEIQPFNLPDSASLTNQWTKLKDSEYDRVIQVLLKKGSIDKGASKVTDKGILIDGWGDRYQIAVRENEQGEIEYKVWSQHLPEVLGGD